MNKPNNMKGRQRGRNGGGGGKPRPMGGGGGGGGGRNPNYDGGQRMRGNAQQLMEKYLALARDASSAGDRVLAENYFQHADHYYRTLNARFEQQQNGNRGGQNPGQNGNTGQNYNQGGYNQGGYNQGQDDGDQQNYNDHNQGGHQGNASQQSHNQQPHHQQSHNQQPHNQQPQHHQQPHQHSQHEQHSQQEQHEPQPVIQQAAPPAPEPQRSPSNPPTHSHEDIGLPPGILGIGPPPGVPLVDTRPARTEGEGEARNQGSRRRRGRGDRPGAEVGE